VAASVAAARSHGPEGSRLSARVRAAGGLVVRDGDLGPEVLVVHRPAYDDWTFPKGKAEPGESDEACAVREVEEETGLRCSLGRELPSTEYVDAGGRLKRVRYWLMRVESGAVVFLHEIDDARWLRVDEAASTLTYARDEQLLRALAEA
jgi:8-oxo-dGTP pyrophosphatase MutT (NUDIX family)